MKWLAPYCILLVLLISACNTLKFVTFPINYTPKSYFKPDTTTLVLINQLDSNDLNTHNAKKLAVFKAAAYTGIKYAKTLLGQLAHVHVINLVDSVNFTANNDSVKQLVAKFHADYVLALKNFSAEIGYPNTDDANMYYSTKVVLTYFLYESNGIYYKKLNGATNDPTSAISSDLLTSLIFRPTIKGSKTELKIAAEHATQDALQDYLPYTVTRNRPLYNDAQLQPGVNKFTEAKYIDAERLLVPFLKDNNPQLASKAAYDLAVVYEAEGDINGAAAMAQQSQSKHKNVFAADLIAALKED